MRNLESAFIKLRRHKLAGRSLTIYLRRQDFNAAGMEARLTRYSSSTLDFTGICDRLFNKIFEPSTPYRATGVILSELVCEELIQIDLFDDPVMVERTRSLGSVIDAINAAHGKHAIHLASSCAIGRKTQHPRNELAWRKTALLKGETFRRRIGIPLLKLG